MILDLILLVLQGVLNIVLAPLTALNIGIDFISSLPVVVQFLQIVAYILPWSNILPLLILAIGIGLFRLNAAIVHTIVEFLPFF